MPEARVLRVFNRVGRSELPTHRLSNESVRHLSEYDAVVLEPTWSAMFGGVQQQPGTRVRAEPGSSARGIDYVNWYSAELRRRATELEPFFRLGGIFVLRIREDMTLVHPGNIGTEISAHSWFEGILIRAIIAAGVMVVYNNPTVAFTGSGAMVNIDPGHTFEPYLRAVSTYDCRLHAGFLSVPQATVLAENRAGEPVAVELPVLNGAILLVPPPDTEAQEKMLEAAVVQSVEQRIESPDAWALDDERALVETRDAAVAEQRRLRAESDGALLALRRVKGMVLGEEIVKRALDYYASATRSSATPERAMGRLYKMWEMLEEYCGGSEMKLAEALTLPLLRIKRIKSLANNPSLDLRHSNAKGTSQPPEGDVAEAIEIAREMLHRFIEVRYEARTRREPASATSEEALPPLSR